MTPTAKELLETIHQGDPVARMAATLLLADRVEKAEKILGVFSNHDGARAIGDCAVTLANKVLRQLDGKEE